MLSCYRQYSLLVQLRKSLAECARRNDFYIQISAMRGTWRSASHYFENDHDEQQKTCKRCEKLLEWGRQQQAILLRLEKNLIEKQQHLDNIMRDLQKKASQAYREKIELHQQFTNFLASITKNFQKYLVPSETKQHHPNFLNYKENTIPKQPSTKNICLKNVGSPKIKLPDQSNQAFIPSDYMKQHKNTMDKILSQLNKILFENSTLKSYNETLLEKLRISKKNKL